MDIPHDFRINDLVGIMLQSRIHVFIATPKFFR